MSDRTVRRFVAALLRGRGTVPARPNDVDAAQMRTAIALRAARLGDAPRESFISDLHRRLAEETSTQNGPQPLFTPRRRHVVIGGSVAAASVAAGLVVGRNLLTRGDHAPQAHELDATGGTWEAVGVSADLAQGQVLAFDTGPVNGFVHRGNTQLKAVSGVCTHQGCKLWFDAPDNRLRCPCHSTSFSLDGDTLTHQLPTAPPPLRSIEVRDNNGSIEILAPTESA